MSPVLQLARMTGAQAQAALATNPVILLPLGSHESHGPSLPMGDFLLAEAIALRIAAAAHSQGHPCLVAPTLPFGGVDFFGSVPFALALAQPTLRLVLADLLAGLFRHNLTRVIILNGHGGNSQAIHEATLAIRRTHGVIIPSLYLWKVARALMDQLPGMNPAGRAAHGADPVASIAMHLLSAQPPTGPGRPAPPFLGLDIRDFGTATFRGVPLDLPLELADIAPDGIAPGVDPSHASAEDGARLTTRLVEIGAALVAHVAGGR
jgi:creatinine amidohydrolase